eukprot:GDKI01017973.1.p1 GENE.GDKI01017973.1~~GDKI01017973.1.p1  ORF type:complete len:228 (-),score=47.37 GDKI01017973.1:155-775(-)
MAEASCSCFRSCADRGDTATNVQSQMQEKSNTTCFEVAVTSPDFKFCCAHFVAYRGFREKLHGHNYTVSCRLGGPLSEQDGYVLDFGDLKSALRKVCKTMNECLLLPAHSAVLQYTHTETSVHIRCEDGAEFMLPKTDCLMLPIKHSTAEEIAQHMWQEVADILTEEKIRERGLKWMEISVAERPTQEAKYRRRFTHTHNTPKTEQ